MHKDTKAILKKSDWVKGIARNGELIIGFIDSMSMVQGAVNVTVAESDNEEIIGKTIPILANQVESIPMAKNKDLGELEFLIDLALKTGDEEWFHELTGELKGKTEVMN